MSPWPQVRLVSASCLTALLMVCVAAADGIELSGRTYASVGDTLWVYSGGSRWEVIGDVVTIAPSQAQSEQELADTLSTLGLEIGFRDPGGSYYDIPIPAGSGPIDVLGTCLRHLDISDAWANTRVRLASAPSDSFYAEHIGWWRQWNLTRIRAEDAWSVETGDTTIILAVLDSGVELDHADLRGNLWINWSEYNGTTSVDDDDNKYVDDVYGINVDDNSGDVDEQGGHGTHVSGIAAAQTNNAETGIAGLAGGWYDSGWSPGERGKGCLIMTAASPSANHANLRKGLLYAAAMGAHVANMSFVTTETLDWTEAIEAAVDSGMVLVAAAGNGADEECEFPACHQEVIAVGAVDYLDRDVYWQSWGDSLEVVAPSGACKDMGHACVDPCTSHFAGYLCQTPAWCVCDSMFLWTTGNGFTEDGYNHFSGTSAASPQVAALAGLLLSADSSLDRDDVRSLIRSSAQDKIGDSEDTRGRDNRYGFGRIDAYTALYLAKGGGATISDVRLCYDVEFDRDVKVNSGNTLTILPGVTVEFAANSDAANLGVDSGRCELIVEGTLTAHGIDPDTLVTFTSSGTSAGDWYGIRAPSDKGSIDLRHCVIENAYKGVAVDNPTDLELAQLKIDDCTAHGIYCEDCDSSAKVDSCTLTSPGLVGIEARDCIGMTLRGHDITDASDYGIKCYDVANMTVVGNYVLGDSSSVDFVGIRVKPEADTSAYSIEGNTVERCSSKGIWCAKGTGDDATVEKNCVSDSDYSRGGTGVYFYYSSAKMRQTTVETKTHGVVAICGTVSGTFWKPDLGDSTGLGENGDNRFIDNSLYYIWTMGLGDSTVMAERNWHGTSPPSRSKFYGNIDYVPYLTSDPGSFPRVVPGEVRQPRLTLDQNHPNPFNPVTNISFNVPKPGHVTLGVYNVAGRLVRSLVDERRESGGYDVVWDGCDDRGRAVASGVYFARLKNSSEVEIMKLVLLK